jgi:Na+/proline symporter
MSTLSSSLNALASSTVFDLGSTLRKLANVGSQTDLALGRIATAFWGVIFMIFASLFTDRESSVVELGLSIASFTYGGLLGAFVLGIVNRRANQFDAIVALLVTLVLMSIVIKWLIVGPDGLEFALAGAESPLRSKGWQGVAWPWYPLIGTVISVVTGSTLALRHR